MPYLGSMESLGTARLHTWPVQMVCRETRMAGQSSMKKIAHTHSTLHELLPGVASVFSSLADWGSPATGSAFSSSSENSSSPAERLGLADCRTDALEAIVEARVEALEERLVEMKGNEDTSAAAMSSIIFSGWVPLVSDTFELVDAFGVPPKRMLEILELMEALSTLLVCSLVSISSVTSAGASSSADSISSSFLETRELVEAFLLAIDTRELTEAFFELADAFLEVAEARAETGWGPLSSSSSVRAAAVLLSAAGASFSLSSWPNSESGERVSVTVLFLKTRVSYS